MLEMSLMLFDFLPKIMLSIFCGSLIGFERELKDKPAGIRTYMLISTGATLFTLVGIHYSGEWVGVADPMRVAAQVVTGVGFLGAGTIIFARGHIRGLTTAAAIWMSAAIGMSIGVGMLVFPVVVTLITVLALIFLGRLERALGLKGRKRYKFQVMGGARDIEVIQSQILSNERKFNIIEMDSQEDMIRIVVVGHLTRSEKAGFLKALRKHGCNFKLFDD